MVTEKKQANAMTWKSLIAVIILFSLIKILHRLISEAAAWAVAGFVSAMILHLAPPRSPLAFGKVLLLALGVAVLLFVMTKLIG